MEDENDLKSFSQNDRFESVILEAAKVLVMILLFMDRV